MEEGEDGVTKKKRFNAPDHFVFGGLPLEVFEIILIYLSKFRSLLPLRFLSRYWRAAVDFAMDRPFAFGGDMKPHQYEVGMTLRRATWARTNAAIHPSCCVAPGVGMFASGSKLNLIGKNRIDPKKPLVKSIPFVSSSSLSDMKINTQGGDIEVCQNYLRASLEFDGTKLGWMDKPPPMVIEEDKEIVITDGGLRIMDNAVKRFFATRVGRVHKVYDEGNLLIIVTDEYIGAFEKRVRDDGVVIDFNTEVCVAPIKCKDFHRAAPFVYIFMDKMTLTSVVFDPLSNTFNLTRHDARLAAVCGNMVLLLDKETGDLELYQIVHDTPTNIAFRIVRRVARLTKNSKPPKALSLSPYGYTITTEGWTTFGFFSRPRFGAAAGGAKKIALAWEQEE